MTRIAICIVNYNNGVSTIRCIQSLLEQTFQDFNIILIDNCSTDNSIASIEAFYMDKGLSMELRNEKNYLGPLPDGIPGILIIGSAKNGGYAYGVNIGIRFTRTHDEFSHILVINNDVLVKSGFLDEMVNEFGRRYTEYNSEKIALGAVELSPTGKRRHFGFHYLNLLTGYVLPFPLFPSLKYIVGSAIFIGAGAPLMDESFFLYFEDIQYRQTLKKNNYYLLSCRHAFYFHELGGSSNKDKNLYKIIFTSLKQFYKLNYPYLLPFVLFLRCIISLFMGRWRIAYYILFG